VASDPSVRQIQQLDGNAREAAVRLVTHVRQAGVPLIVTSALRLPAEQAELVRTGRSKTLRSKHLSGLAFDVDVHGFDRSSIPRWWFYQLGALAEPLGLRWGGNFRGFWDPGHFEDARTPR